MTNEERTKRIAELGPERASEYSWSATELQIALHGLHMNKIGATLDPQEVINFIEANFDLAQKTGGPV